MSNNEQKTGIIYIIIILLLILMIVISSCIGIFAWAKYTSAIDGTATAQVAKWSFKVLDGLTETTDVIDFAITRTDGYGEVEKGVLAPGTFGEFEIEIDARGTETILGYTIDVDLENKPTNLKLYSDSAKTKEIEVNNSSFSLEGFMSLEDVKEIKTVTVYWDWPYESIDDSTDIEDAGKTMNMQISVTGMELLELPEIISFTITTLSGTITTYNAEKNMTWEEWVDSSYNTDGYSINYVNGRGYTGYVVENGGRTADGPTAVYISKDEVIKTNGNYREDCYTVK